MGVWELWFVLLLLLPAYNNSQVTPVKITEREPYVTPICTDASVNVITLVACKITYSSAERSRGEECRLAYKNGEEFFNGCDSRFTFMKKNQTILLHLTGLTPVDSGNYSCECVYPKGTSTLHLNIAVEEDETNMTEVSRTVTTVVVIALNVVAGVVLGFILRKNLSRDCLRSDASGLSVCETSRSLDRDDPDDPFTSLQQPSDDLYQTISSIHHQHDSKTISASNIMELDDQEIDERETDPSWEIYENI